MDVLEYQMCRLPDIWKGPNMSWIPDVMEGSRDYGELSPRCKEKSVFHLYGGSQNMGWTVPKLFGGFQSMGRLILRCTEGSRKPLTKG